MFFVIEFHARFIEYLFEFRNHQYETVGEYYAKCLFNKLKFRITLTLGLVLIDENNKYYFAEKRYISQRKTSTIFRIEKLG